MFTILKDLIKGNPQRKPAYPIAINTINTLPILNPTQAKAIWFGHSTVLLELEGKRILVDPTFADSPSPFPLIGGKRFSRILPLEPEKLPPIDVVLLSHDHYDHLDYHSIMQINHKTRLFCVPIGLKKRLEGWGIEQERIKELEWWQEEIFADLTLICAPAQHFSGRTLFDRNTTLWCSWVIIGAKTKIFFSGDGGYGLHFEQIGKKYGPFDLTLMECGQYDERWATIHMMPEETVQAHIDVNGNLLLPIHWGAFSLAFHGWTEPIERAIAAARKRAVRITTPKIGEAVLVGDGDYPADAWWR